MKHIALFSLALLLAATGHGAAQAAGCEATIRGDAVVVYPKEHATGTYRGS